MMIPMTRRPLPHRPFPHRTSSRHLTLFLTFGIAAVALSGCVVGPNFTRPVAPKSLGYGMKGDAPSPSDVALGEPATGPWWRVFGSVDLDRTVDLALAGNPNLTVADANLRQARQALSAARGGLYPEVDANAGVERERLNLASFGFTNFPGISTNPMFNLYSRSKALRRVLKPSAIRPTPPP